MKDPAQSSSVNSFRNVYRISSSRALGASSNLGTMMCDENSLPREGHVAAQSVVGDVAGQNLLTSPQELGECKDRETLASNFVICVASATYHAEVGKLTCVDPRAQKEQEVIAPIGPAFPRQQPPRHRRTNDPSVNGQRRDRVLFVLPFPERRSRVGGWGERSVVGFVQVAGALQHPC